MLVAGLAGASRVATGILHSCAQPGDALSCWGANVSGVIGLPDQSSISPAPRLIAITGVAEFSSRNNFGCARKAADGTVWCWGQRRFGEIGREAIADASEPPWDVDPHHVPRQLVGLTGTRGISIGLLHACAILADKTVACWGFNASTDPGSRGGQLGHDPTIDPICNAHVCNDVPIVVAGATNIRELALGYRHSCALREDGSVLCWGMNDVRQLGHDPALDVDGGPPDPATAVPHPVPVTGLSNVAHIAAGENHTCAVTNDERILCWGSNGYQELGTLQAGSGTFMPVQVEGL